MMAGMEPTVKIMSIAWNNKAKGFTTLSIYSQLLS